MSNIIVTFAEGQIEAVADETLEQWAYGQKLQFVGLDLPANYQVDFSNWEFCGDSIPRIGDEDGVSVPTEVLTSGRNVYAFVWIQTAGAGRRLYRATIRVKPGPMPDPGTPSPEEESALAQAIEALNDAAEHYPRIVGGYWYVWDATEGEYVNTNVKAEGADGQDGEDGEDGFSPAVTVTEISGGHRITITDAEHPVEGQSFDVMDGTDGGLTPTAIQLLIGILQKGIYTVDVSEDIETLYEILTDEGEIVIPATSVTLSESTVTILDASNTVQLVASPVPSVTTDTPVWTSSDSTIATVDANGVVTGISDGDCVIRCTYGNVFAECSVFCTLGADLIWALPTAFTGDGESVINTGWKMAGANIQDSGYNTDFSIVYDVEVTAVPANEMAFISSVDSGGRNYLLDLVGFTVGNIRFSSTTIGHGVGNTTWTKATPIRAKCVRTHEKLAREMSEYFYYVTGDALIKDENFIESNAALLSYDITNPVVLGGRQNTDGTIASYMDSSVTIHDFKIYSRVLSSAEISEYLGKDVTA